MESETSITPAVFRNTVAQLLSRITDKQPLSTQIEASKELLLFSRRKAGHDSVSSSSSSGNNRSSCCDTNSLGIAFSFLESHDFVAAIGVCKRWYSARLRPHSWPTFLRVYTMMEACDAINSEDEHLQLQGATFFRKSAEHDHFEVEQYPTRCMDLAYTTNNHWIKMELIDILSMTTTDNLGLVDLLLHLFRHSNRTDLKAKAARAMGKLARGDLGYHLIKMHALPLLIKFCKSFSSSSSSSNHTSAEDAERLSSGVWALSEFCSFEDSTLFDRDAVLTILIELLLHNDDDRILKDACHGLTQACPFTIVEKHVEHVQSLLKAGVVPRLVQLLDRKNEDLVIHALHIVKKICWGNEAQTQAMLDAQLLRKLPSLLMIPNTHKSAVHCLVAITKANKSQITAVVNCSNLRSQIMKAVHDKRRENSRSAIRVLQNVCRFGGPTNVSVLVQAGLIPLLCGLFTGQSINRVVEPLKALGCVLAMGEHMKIKEQEMKHCTCSGGNPYALLTKECGGMHVLVDLQFDKAKDVKNKALELLRSHFADEELLCNDEQAQFILK
jgi:hypothetical protein